MSDSLYLEDTIGNSSLSFARTSRFSVLEVASATPSSVSSLSPASSIAETLSLKIATVGEEIRQLKAAKATKDEIMAKVAVLNGLKEDFESKTGSKYEAPAAGGGGKPGKGGKSGGAPAAAPVPAANQAELDKKFQVIKSIGEECTKESDLVELLKMKPDSFRLYDGFEPSGRMHIAQGIFKAINVNKCTASGGTFVFWVADWFALMNDKMGGDLDKIKDVGRYFVEVWTAAGMDMSKVEFRWASDDITKKADTYWPQMLDIARRFTLARVNKCCTIMGRAEGNLTAAQILYPLMQCTDVFFLRADICQLGVDQRKVNMLAREYCAHAGIKLKPVILSHHMIYGLKAGQAKMSKSDAESAIFMEDTREDIKRKINNAFCPKEGSGEKKADNELRLVEDDLENPCLDYVKHIVLSDENRVLTAGGVTYTTFDEVKSAFLSGSLSEANLKEALIDAVDELVAPVRKHFSENSEASALLERIAEYKREDQAAAAEKAAAKPMRRLSLGLEGTAHVVFAPIPSASCPLSVVFTLLKSLRAAPADKQPVLWLSDWSAMVLSSLDGDMKVIKAAYIMMVEAIKALDLKLGGDGLKRVKVMFQSEAILTGPSEYWISVINVGRALKVREVQQGYPTLPISSIAKVAATSEASGAAEGGAEESQEVSEPVGCVIAALMFVGDVLALAPHTITGGINQGQIDMALTYWKSSGIEKRNSLAAPLSLTCETVSTWMSKETPVETALFSAQSHEDDYFIGDDPKAGANKKMKRAFCEPTNSTTNPPLAIARDVLLDLFGSFQAGEKNYSGAGAWSSMKADFEADVLTPQLLKPAVTTGMASLLDVINTHIKSASPEAKKADTVLKAWNTKNSKKGGGGGGGKKQQQKKK